MPKKHRRFDVRQMAASEFNVRRELRHIEEKAAAGETCIVSIGPLVLFSTASGDAWVLDAGDGLACCVASAGEPVPVRIVEDRRRFAIEWTHDFQVGGRDFLVASKEEGIVAAIRGYPVSEILAAVARVRNPPF